MDIVFRVSPCVCVVPTVVCHLTQDKREGTAMRRPQAFRLTCSPTESDNTTQDPGCTIREIAVTSDYIVAKHHEDTNHRVSRWIPNVSVPHPLLSLSHTSLFLSNRIPLLSRFPWFPHSLGLLSHRLPLLGLNGLEGLH